MKKRVCREYTKEFDDKLKLWMDERFYSQNYFEKTYFGKMLFRFHRWKKRGEIFVEEYDKLLEITGLEG